MATSGQKVLGFLLVLIGLLVLFYGPFLWMIRPFGFSLRQLFLDWPSGFDVPHFSFPHGAYFPPAFCDVSAIHAGADPADQHLGVCGCGKARHEWLVVGAAGLCGQFHRTDRVPAGAQLTAGNRARGESHLSLLQPTRASGFCGLSALRHFAETNLPELSPGHRKRLARVSLLR